MAQRWMQAKLIIARKHGRTVSGSGSAWGDVKEDRAIGFVAPTLTGVAKKQVRNVVLKSDRPKAWTYTGSDPYTC